MTINMIIHYYDIQINNLQTAADVRIMMMSGH